MSTSLPYTISVYRGNSITTFHLTSWKVFHSMEKSLIPAPLRRQAELEEFHQIGFWYQPMVPSDNLHVQFLQKYRLLQLQEKNILKFPMPTPVRVTVGKPFLTKDGFYTADTDHYCTFGVNLDKTNYIVNLDEARTPTDIKEGHYMADYVVKTRPEFWSSDPTKIMPLYNDGSNTHVELQIILKQKYDGHWTESVVKKPQTTLFTMPQSLQETMKSIHDTFML